MSNQRYGGAYDGYWLSEPSEACLREDDARGFFAEIYWHEYVQFLSRKLVWC